MNGLACHCSSVVGAAAAVHVSWAATSLVPCAVLQQGPRDHDPRETDWAPWVPGAASSVGRGLLVAFRHHSG